MKKFSVLLVAAFIMTAFTFSASALNAENDIRNEIEQGFFSSLDEEVAEILEEFGVDSLDAEGIFSDGIENIGAYFYQSLSDRLKADSAWFFMMLCIILLISIARSFYDFSGDGEFLRVLAVSVVCLSSVGMLNDLLSCILASMSLNGKLMLSFVPVFALIVSLAGNPASGIAYNGFVLFFCEVMSLVTEKILGLFIGCYFALSVSFSFNPCINISRFSNSVSRILNLILGLSASLFTGLLSLKNVLAYSTDSLSVKGVRFLLSSTVPVIGSSLSDAYSAFLGSINLMKNSLAIVGIFSLAVINVPTVAEGVISFFFLSVLSCIAEILGLSKTSEVLRCIGNTVKFLLLTCVFQVFILIVSVGIMLSVKGAVYG